MKKWITGVCIVLHCAAVAQTTEATSAPGWELSPLTRISGFTVQDFDREAALANRSAQGDKTMPYIFGENYSVSIDLKQVTSPQFLDDGSAVYQYLIAAESATSLNFIFDAFYLPQGAYLYVYNPERTQLIGAYSHLNNNSAQVLGTELIEDDEVVLELHVQTPSLIDDVQLHLGQITCGFEYLNKVARKYLRDFDDSGDCNVDVNCPLGNGWEDQIRSVALIIANGNGLCSGALINNTLNDGTPYFLTAEHCGTNPTSWVFRFRWESNIPSCATTATSGNGNAFFESINGAVSRAFSTGSDFHLIELNTSPDPAWDIYYAGWDRTDSPVSQATGIHHPSGDIKKICREDQALTQTTWSGADVWEVADWDQGVTEGGSSGSPLFDQNGRIIGQLYGGTAACNGIDDNNEPDFYGRIAVSWNGANASERLSDWLDPNNSGATVWDGYNPLTITNDDDVLVASGIGVEPLICNEEEILLEFKFRNNGFNALSSLDVYAELNGSAQLLTNWTGYLASGDYETINLPAITITDGDNQVLKIYTANPNGVTDQDTSNDTLTFLFDAKTQGHLFTLDYYHDCYGSEVSMEVNSSSSGSLDWSLPQGSLSDNAWFGLNGSQKFCLTDSCGTLTINDAGGDGWNAGIGDNCLATSVGVYLDILNADGVGIASLPDPAFGSQVQIDFCKSGFSSTQNPEKFEVTMVPNPATTQLKVKAPQPVVVQLFNVQGQVVLNGATMKNEHTLDLNGLSKGLYLLKWNSGITFGQEKLIKE